MQRPARSIPLRLWFPLAVALIAGCVTVEDEPTLTTAEAACGACVSPPLVNWVRGGPGADELFPRDLEHLQVLLTPADDRSFFALGVGDRQALWLYRVPMGDQSNLMGAIAGAAAAHHEAGLTATIGVQGGIKGPPPKGPHPVGDPPFSAEFIGVVVEAAVTHEEVTEQMFEQLGSL